MNRSRHDPWRADPPARRPWARRRGILFFLALLLVPTAGFAAQSAPRENSIAIFIAELALLLLVGRLMGEAAQRIGHPPVMGQLIGGLLLGPSALGRLWPAAEQVLFTGDAAQKSLIQGVSELGVLMLLLLTGMETDLALVKRVGRAAVLVAIAGVAIPFACGVALGLVLPTSLLPRPETRLVTALFLGTALSISSVKIVAIVVREMNFMRRNIGLIIVASAILEDTIGWVILAIAFGLAEAGTIDLWSLGRSVLGTLAFMAASLTVGRRVVFNLIRWTNDHFSSEFPVITTILLIMAGMALLTQWIGVNLVLGAFVAGILVGESPILTRHIKEQLRGLIVALFMPVFFGLSGLSADLSVLRQGGLAALGAVLIVIACVGKFLGAFVGGKLSGLLRSEALALACAMNARGSTEVIIASIGLSMSVLSQNLYTLIVTMAIVTTVSMPPMLRWALKRVPVREEEQIRLEREKLDARGFVTNLERLLVAIDDSWNGKLAARIAGVIGGSGDKPTTVLEMTAHDPRKAGAQTQPAQPALVRAQAEDSARDVQSAAQSVTTLQPHADEEKPGSVDVTTVDRRMVGAADIAEEARKGYDLLVIGIADTRDPDGGFSRAVSLIAQNFAGPIALADAHGVDAERLLRRPGKILVPVNGTEYSRRAAEIAFTVARASGALVTVLYVTRPDATAGRDRGAAQAARRSNLAVVADIGALADRFDVSMRHSMREHAAPIEAILEETTWSYDLVVLGANRRPGETLFFGNTAAAVFERCDTPILFVAT
jgi:Kef-type K+ transport system membrane component KefB/nucleotide-binding universal stress UspA family protein